MIEEAKLKSFIIGESSSMKKTLDQVEMVMWGNFDTVLIAGDAGTDGICCASAGRPLPGRARATKMRHTNSQKTLKGREGWSFI